MDSIFSSLFDITGMIFTPHKKFKLNLQKHKITK